MPLIDGSTDEIISENIAQLIHEGYSREQAAAIAYAVAGKTNPETEKKIYARSPEAIKRVEAKVAGRIGGYLIKFSNAEAPDLEGEYFDAETDFMIGPWAYRPVLYHHGLDKTLKAVPVGLIDTLKIDKVGLWAEAQLDLRNEYVEAILRLIDEGVIAWSSGSYPHLIDKDAKGHIKMWPLAEGSLTPTPAEPQGTEIRSLQDMRLALLREHSEAKSGLGGIDAAGIEAGQQITEGTATDNAEVIMSREELMAIIEEVVNRMLADYKAEMGQNGAGIREEDEEDVVKAGQTEAEAIAQAVEEEKDKEEQGKAVRKALESETAMARIFGAMYKATLATMENQRARSAKALQTAREQAKDWHLESAAKSQGGGFRDRGGQTAITVEEPEEWRYASGDDMAMGFKILAAAQYPIVIPRNLKIGDVVSEEYARAMMHKVALETKSNPPFQNIHANDGARKSGYYAYTKAWRGIKADELDAVAITNQGAEWAFIDYDTRLWDRVRPETKLFNLMVERGMRTMDVSGKTMNVKMRTGSPTVYTVPEARSVDGTGSPENTVQITPFTTDEKAVNIATHAVAVAYSDQLDEQSVIPVAANVNEDLLQTLAESLESVFINGDTTATASNINTDATPATGMSSPDYLAWDGFRHIPLVDYTTRGHAKGATLAIEDFINTIKLLDDEFFGIRDKTGLFILDTDTEIATRKLLALLTKEVAGDQATIFSGSLSDLFQVPFYNSGKLGKAQADGTNSATAASNTRGQVLYVNAPYWQYGRQTETRVRAGRNELGLSTYVVASVFHCLAARGDNAAAMTYNIIV